MITRTLWLVFEKLRTTFNSKPDKANQSALDHFEQKHQKDIEEFLNEKITVEGLEILGFKKNQTSDNLIYYTIDGNAGIHYDIGWSLYNIKPDHTLESTSTVPQYLTTMTEVLKYSGIERRLKGSNY